jgi:hypothetical protein
VNWYNSIRTQNSLTKIINIMNEREYICCNY